MVVGLTSTCLIVPTSLADGLLHPRQEGRAPCWGQGCTEASNLSLNGAVLPTG